MNSLREDGSNQNQPRVCSPALRDSSVRVLDGRALGQFWSCELWERSPLTPGPSPPPGARGDY